MLYTGSCMQERELAEMFAVEMDHWWFAGKRILFKRLLATELGRGGLRILDVGCGTGASACEFGAYGEVWATDRSTSALAMARSRGVTKVFVCDGGQLPLVTGSFDLVLAFDVLEHSDDDHAMLNDIARVLRPGGSVAIHVPAWPSLWSRHDEILGHKRRYTRRSLRALMERSELDIGYFGWASASILVPALLMRTTRRLLASDGGGQDIYPLPAPLNSALRAVYRAEALIAARVGLPFGLSLAAIAHARR